MCMPPRGSSIMKTQRFLMLFFPQHQLMWVSLTYSPEHRGRQCRNFTLPRGSVKRHHYCCYCYFLFVAVPSGPHRMRSNTKKTPECLMNYHQTSRKHNAFYRFWIKYHENTTLFNAFSHNTSWCGSP